MVNGLLKTAQGIPPGAEATLNPQQDAALKLAAIKCLVGVLRSMGDWLNRQLRLTDSPYLKTADTDDNTSESSGGVSGHVPEGGEEGAPAAEEGSSSEAGPETSEAASFEQRRAYKLEFQVHIHSTPLTSYLGQYLKCTRSNSLLPQANGTRENAPYGLDSCGHRVLHSLLAMTECLA